MSNVIQIVAWEYVHLFVERFVSGGVPVFACYAWEPRGLNLRALEELGVHLAEAPFSLEELSGFFMGEELPRKAGRPVGRDS